MEKVKNIILMEKLDIKEYGKMEKLNIKEN